MLELQNRYNETFEKAIKIVNKNGEVKIYSNDCELLLSGDYNKIENAINTSINNIKRDALLNAKDCLYYGYGKAFWNDCGLSKNVAHEIWEQAKKEMERL